MAADTVSSALNSLVHFQLARMDPQPPSYRSNPPHRNRAPEKSQWTITRDQEIAAFELAWRRSWLLSCAGWGFHYEENRLEYLGVAQDHATRLFVAKFVCDSEPELWHGYPADHRKQQDVPDEAILNRWLREDVLPAAKIRKLAKGQPCKL